MRKGNPHTIKGKGFDAHPENICKTGHPKGTKNRATILRKWIDTKKKFEDPTGKLVEGTLEDEIYLALLAKGLEKDVAAIKEINDTLYGKIAEKGEFKTESQVNLNVIDFSDIDTEDLKALNEIIKKKK